MAFAVKLEVVALAVLNYHVSVRYSSGNTENCSRFNKKIHQLNLKFEITYLGYDISIV